VYIDNERRPALTPQLAIRVAIIGGVALAAFAIIFFRLWYLQVLSADEHLAEARDNQVRRIKVQAPRGQVVDREGRLLVRNRPSLAVKVTPDKLPEDRAERMAMYRKLGRLLGRKPRAIDRDVERQLTQQQWATATVKQDVDHNMVMYLMEHQEEFPAVTVEQVFLREYPHREIGAHLFGTVGEVSEKELEEPDFRGVEMGDRVGKSGVELEYDKFLRGENGASRVQVDALGNFRKNLQVVQPKQGYQLRLSLDLDVQEAGQQALMAGTGKGAFVAMDVNTGEVLGLGSQPSFDPNVFAKTIRQSDLDKLYSKDLGEPIVNRAIQGGYPTGSTFKLVTATAALEGGLITPDTPQHDGGSITVGGVTFKNAGDAVHGTIALRQALTVSSDVFFYLLGRDMNGSPQLQDWARRLGVGRLTGIDLPGELPGRIPTPKWRNELFKKDLTDRPWSVGDNINLSVGQGDIAANPLQMAVAYATIANGGKVVRPRLGQRIEESDGRVRQQLEAPPARRLPIDEEFRTAIMEGLYGAANGPGGTSTAVFEGFPIPVAGKTGTAEKGAGRADQSWYVALAPYPNPRYVVAVTDEAGGFGADTAAPMARRILSALFEVDETKLVEGGDAPD
jgi:penicillin-binding protein 2